MDLLCCFIIYTEVSFEMTFLCIKPKLWSKCQLKKTLSCVSCCLSQLSLFLQRQQYKHSIEIKTVRKNDAYRLHRQPTSQQLSSKVWMTILRISEAVWDTILSLLLRNDNQPIQISQRHCIQTPQKNCSEIVEAAELLLCGLKKKDLICQTPRKISYAYQHDLFACNQSTLKKLRTYI